MTLRLFLYLSIHRKSYDMHLITLFRILRQHRKLSEKRNPMFETNKFAQFWGYFMALFWIGYLIFFGTLFAFAFDEGSREPYHVLNAGFIFVLGIDFLMRFAFQKTPTQEMKPYMLLPIRRHRLIDVLLLRSGLQGYNLLWLFFYVPFAILTVTRFYGVWGVCTYCIGVWMLMLLNNYWFLFCRTLMNERFLWLLLPIAYYGGIACALFIPEESPLYDWSTTLGEYFIQGEWIAFATLAVIILLMFLINRAVMQRLVYAELSKVETTTEKVGTLSEYRFLNRFGIIGEYMRLELKLFLRNKMCRKSLYMIFGVVLMFSLLISFSDVYEGGMRDFLILYNFAIFGILGLSGLMAYEGNYIDGLMSRKESIYALLRAKYMLWSTAMVFPLLLNLPAIFTGKVELLTCLGWLFFVPGPIYCLLFQLAVLNKKTLNLNVKLTNRQNIGTGYQNLITSGALFIPIIVNSILKALVSQEMASWILIAIGLTFIATSKYWIRNVYHRFMKRRYENMEGFRDTRQR